MYRLANLLRVTLLRRCLLLFILLFSPLSQACDACFYDGYFSVPWFKVMKGDDIKYASPEYDDAPWPFYTLDYSLVDYQGVYWLRGVFKVDKAAIQPGLAYELHLSLLAAYELYIDGRLVGKSGRVGATIDEELPGAYRNYFPIPPDIIEKGESTFALRMSSWHRIQPEREFFDPFGRIADNRVRQAMWVEAATIENRRLNFDDLMHYLFVMVPLVIAGYFFTLYLGYRQAKHVLVFSLLCLALFVVGLSDLFRWGIGFNYNWYTTQWWVSAVSITAATILFPLFFLSKFNLPYKIWWISVLMATAIGSEFFVENHMAGRVALMLAMVVSFLIHIVAFRQKQHQVWPTAVGLIVCIIAVYTLTGLFFMSITVFILFVLAQLAKESNTQRSDYIKSLVNASRLEAQLLRKNIQPHFLMNSLTSLMEWIEVDPETGAEFVEALGDEFRLLTNIADQPLIPVNQEIELCRLHMQIMGFRLQKQFELVLKGIDSTEQVPPAVLHTLVENGISHNNYGAQGVTFTLTFERDEGVRRYTLTTPVENNTGVTTQGTGTGLKYIKAQLERVYPGGWTFDARLNGGDWVSVIEIQDKR